MDINSILTTAHRVISFPDHFQQPFFAAYAPRYRVAALFLFAYGKNMNSPSIVNRALELLELLSAEENNITRQFSKTGIKIRDAFASQAIIQLKKSYCDKKKCLYCGIGTRLLNN